MSNWYEAINSATEVITEKIKKHPFIVELMEGTLSKDTFYFYIHQDAFYLAEYKKTLAILGARCSEEEDTQFFLDSATGIMEVENSLHQNFLVHTKISDEPSPTCELYTSYLSKMVHGYSLEEALAAVLPCFTIYKEVGDYILEKQTNAKTNPYQDWIQTYGGDYFAASVKNAIRITNAHAENANSKIVHKMNLAFEKSAKLEWMFWDSAYQQETWKI